MLYKLAASRFDKEIAKADDEKAIRLIRKQFGFNYANYPIYKLTPEEREFAALHTLNDYVSKEKRKIYAHMLKNSYKKPTRTVEKHKQTSFAAKKPIDVKAKDLPKKEIKRLLNNKKTLFKELSAPIGDPEEYVNISHGGTKEHLERFVRGDRVGIETPGTNAKGIWVHHGTESAEKVDGNASEFYANKAHGKSGFSPAVMKARIKRKYLRRTGPNNKTTEAILPEKYVKYLENVRIKKVAPHLSHVDVMVGKEAEKLLKHLR